MKRLFILLLIITAVAFAANAQEFAGIGVAIAKGGQCGDYFRVNAVAESGPASKAGLTAGTCIYEVDGKDIGDLSLEEATAFIRGPVGTNVVLTISKDRKDKITINRQPIQATQIERQYGLVPIYAERNASCDHAYQLKYIFSGSLRELAALKLNTCIYGVNGESVKNMESKDFYQLLRGPLAEEVGLSFNANDLTDQLKVKRAYLDEDNLKLFQKEVDGVFRAERIMEMNRITAESLAKHRVEDSLKKLEQFRADFPIRIKNIFDEIELIFNAAQYAFEPLPDFINLNESRSSGELNDKLKMLSGFIYLSDKNKKHINGSFKFHESNIMSADLYPDFKLVYTLLNKELQDRFGAKGFRVEETDSGQEYELPAFHIYHQHDSKEYHEHAYLKIEPREYFMWFTVSAPWEGRIRGPLDSRLANARCLSANCESGIAKFEITKEDGKIHTYEGQVRFGLAWGEGTYSEPAGLDGVLTKYTGNFTRGQRNGDFEVTAHDVKTNKGFLLYHREYSSDVPMKIIRSAESHQTAEIVGNELRATYDARFYRAKCISGDCEHTNSQYEAYGDDAMTNLILTYEGEMRNGLAHGRGKVTMQLGEKNEDTSIYQGTFTEGEMDGKIYHSVNDLLLYVYEYEKGKKVSTETLADLADLEKWNKSREERIRNATGRSGSANCMRVITNSQREKWVDPPVEVLEMINKRLESGYLLVDKYYMSYSSHKQKTYQYYRACAERRYRYIAVSFNQYPAPYLTAINRTANMVVGHSPEREPAYGTVHQYGSVKHNEIFTEIERKHTSYTSADNTVGAYMSIMGWVPTDKPAPVWVYILIEK